MEFLSDILSMLVAQLQKPTLSFLIGGFVIAAFGSKLEVPAPVYKFIVLVLLLKVGMSAGISVREANLAELLIPGMLAVLVGIAIVLIGSFAFSRMKNVQRVDGMATAGVFGAVSASTLAAGMAVLDEDGIAYEGFIGALYPFMDIAALLTAIVLARVSIARTQTTPSGGDGTATLGGGSHTVFSGLDKGMFQDILTDTLRSPAITALLLGLSLGIFARPDAVFDNFYEPLFRGLLSILMLIMGMEAWARLSELRKVAHAYLAYGLAAPFLHGFLGFGAGLIAHHLTGFSQGGVVLLAVMAASSSDISGPPTLRAALPEANPSAYVGSSTGLGTPIAILSIPLWVFLADVVMT